MTTIELNAFVLTKSLRSLQNTLIFNTNKFKVKVIVMTPSDFYSRRRIQYPDALRRMKGIEPGVQFPFRTT
ncbi:MAG: hypothetical protein MJ159_07460, partial [Treponemataceae bacterium]|nr:hypothetical protein [Treponemataceae bacterium]